MATQAQLDEKARQDRLGAAHAQEEQPPSNSFATPAQLDEKALQEEGGRPPPFADLITPAQLAEKDRRHGPPPLPPRESSTDLPPPPAYTPNDAKRSQLISEQWRSNDPRSSSTHSLVPPESERGGRRTLLLVFIHGFMGNETSFQSFPAHVHNLLTIQLVETHMVHTKIYPRYKSRKAIDFARDDFSLWLEPHESPSTDVVLLGHSMGGILSAEVVLQRPATPATGQPFRHRLLGTINFDTPFLGMHPGVVVSGIGSLFRPAPEPPGSRQQSISEAETTLDNQGSTSAQGYASSSRAESSSASSLVQAVTSPLASPSANDPYFNPPFPNDIRLAERKGLSNFLHFINKHSDGLTSATKQYFMSHLEFGGCLADYPGLKNRYEKIRALEDTPHAGDGLGYRPPGNRVRFTNYYTASTGRPKAPKTPKALPGQMINEDENTNPLETEMNELSLKPEENNSKTQTPRISVEEHRDDAIVSQKFEDGIETSTIDSQMQNLGENSGVQNDVEEPLPEMRHVESMPIEDDDIDVVEQSSASKSRVEGAKEQTAEVENEPLDPDLPPAPPALPPIPVMPTEPQTANFDQYTDKDARKIAEKEHKRVVKLYNQAVKDRDSAIKDRNKLLEKHEKKVRQEREKQLKLDEKQRLKREKEEAKQLATVNRDSIKERNTSSASSIAADTKPKRDKKFCMLPPERGGQRDKCWVRVYMEGVDEVGAHCGLFFPGPQYESLVGDVGERIGQWVEEDATLRAIQEAQRS